MSWFTVPIRVYRLEETTWPDPVVRSVIMRSNQVWRQAEIWFMLHSIQTLRGIQPPAGTSSDPLDEGCLYFLASQYRAPGSIRIFAAPRFARRELGGRGHGQAGFCAIRWHRDVNTTGLMLAHELGHVCNLPHVWRADNLMFGAVMEGTPVGQTLEDEQKTIARSSPAIARFGINIERIAYGPVRAWRAWRW